MDLNLDPNIWIWI